MSFFLRDLTTCKEDEERRESWCRGKKSPSHYESINIVKTNLFMLLDHCTFVRRHFCCCFEFRLHFNCIRLVASASSRTNRTGFLPSSGVFVTFFFLHAWHTVHSHFHMTRLNYEENKRKGIGALNEESRRTGLSRLMQQRIRKPVSC
jgi:hypothetical protein